MPIGITTDHESMFKVAAAWTAKTHALAITRRLLDGENVTAEVAMLRAEAHAMGWTGLLISEDLGGSGQTLAEAAVLVEALGSSCAPLPVAGTLALSSALSGDRGETADILCNDIASGAVTFGILARNHHFGNAKWTGDLGPVEYGHVLTHLAVIDGEDIVIVPSGTEGLVRHDRVSLDPSRMVSSFEAHDLDPATLPRIASGGARLRAVNQILIAADAVGVANACLRMSVEYAKQRRAFGRTIGSFQAIKHHCANMLLGAELATAATWRAATTLDDDALRDLAPIAVGLATERALRNAKTTIQILGGIGFTWEHDAHLYLRRAAFDAIQAGRRHELTEPAARAEMELQPPKATPTSLPPEADAYRTESIALREQVLRAPGAERHRMIVESGYLHPNWPKPWGRSADPIEQIAIDIETGELDRTTALGPTYWTLPIVLPTVIACGTTDQQDRWMHRTMMGETHWCQLFSEPDAGSDLAALRTRAVPTEGGWLVTGQKVWTSNAHNAELGLALVRTDPDAKKHQGITCMVVDMKAQGVTIRPLKQITGSADFNEVFFEDVFVPHDNVIGDVNGGWLVARATLGFERVSLGRETSNTGADWQSLMRMTKSVSTDRPELVSRLGELSLVAEGAKALAQRSAARAILGQSGIEGSIGKLVTAEHTQQVGDFAFELLAHDAAYTDTDSAGAVEFFLHCRMATLAGGTSEILRNLLAERALGLPRDPEPANS